MQFSRPLPRRHPRALLGMAVCLSTLAVALADDGQSRQRLPSHFPKLSTSKDLADDRSLGTEVRWERSIQAAAAKAADEEKLVFVIHVSGDFENPEFT